MKRYLDYKNSGVPWLGDIPAHWITKRIKHITNHTTGWTPPTGDRENYEGENLWATIADIGKKYISETKSKISEQAAYVANISKSPKGSLLFSFKLSVGQVSIVDAPMYTNEAIATFLPSAEYSVLWAYYAFPVFIPENSAINIYGAKLLNQQRINDAYIPLPTLEEQKSIAKYLDLEVARIDELIKEKEELIFLLKEWRQSVIAIAVTKGLNKYARLKPSGIPWLGAIPEHWTVKKIGRYFSAKKGGDAATLTKEYCDTISGDYPVYSGQTENEGVLAKINTYEFDFGDDGVILSTTVGAKAMSLAHIKGRFSLSQNCMIFYPQEHSENTRFIYYHFTPLFQEERKFIPDYMQPSFRMDDFYQFYYASPPLQEQKEIAMYLDAEMGRIDALISHTTEEIDLLKELRYGTIADAVLGRVKVF